VEIAAATALVPSIVGDAGVWNFTQLEAAGESRKLWFEVSEGKEGREKREKGSREWCRWRNLWAGWIASGIRSAVSLLIRRHPSGRMSTRRYLRRIEMKKRCRALLCCRVFLGCVP
jgi:hypothetical protein